MVVERGVVTPTAIEHCIARQDGTQRRIVNRGTEHLLGRDSLPRGGITGNTARTKLLHRDRLAHLPHHRKIAVQVLPLVGKGLGQPFDKAVASHCQIEVVVAQTDAIERLLGKAAQRQFVQARIAENLTQHLPFVHRPHIVKARIEPFTPTAKRLQTTPNGVVLLQHHHPLAGTGQHRGSKQSTGACTEDDGGTVSHWQSFCGTHTDWPRFSYRRALSRSQGRARRQSDTSTPDRQTATARRYG